MKKNLNSPILSYLTNSEKNEFKNFTQIWITEKESKDVTFEDFLKYCRVNSNNKLYNLYIYKKIILHIKKIILEIDNKSLEEHTKVIDLLVKNILG